MIYVGSNCWVGTNSVVMEDIGSNSVIGASSVVAHGIPDNMIAPGNPARFFGASVGRRQGAKRESAAHAVG
jgi:acetyltransferase-like isoleucine patch superfamily enzyme